MGRRLAPPGPIRGRLLAPYEADYHTPMRPRTCTPLTALLLAIFAFLAGPAAGEGSFSSFEEESERVEEVSTEEMTVVRDDPERVRRRVWTSQIVLPVYRTVLQRLWIRVPRAPGRFMPPLRC